MLKLALSSVARHAGSAASGWLIGHGLAEQAQATDITTIIAGVVVYAAMQLWSLAHKAKKAEA